MGSRRNGVKGMTSKVITCALLVKGSRLSLQVIAAPFPTILGLVLVSGGPEQQKWGRLVEGKSCLSKVTLRHLLGHIQFIS